MLLILMKMKLNLTNVLLGYVFNVPSRQVSTIFGSGISVLAANLAFLINWPSKNAVRKHLPSVFKKKFSKCRVIIDCTEVFIERPKSLVLRAQTWSNYKHHNT